VDVSGSVSTAPNSILAVMGNAGFSAASVTLARAPTIGVRRQPGTPGGSAVISEDSSTILDGPTCLDSLVLSANGSITDAEGAAISVTGRRRSRRLRSRWATVRATT